MADRWTCFSIDPSSFVLSNIFVVEADHLNVYIPDGVYAEFSGEPSSGKCDGEATLRW
jgi:hypothetical protein